MGQSKAGSRGLNRAIRFGMPDAEPTHLFPNEDSLCEACGYPIKGLSIDTACPECGLVLRESSPDRRTLQFTSVWLGFVMYWRLVGMFLFRPTAAYRSLSVTGKSLVPEQFLFRTSLLAGLIISAILYLGSDFIIPPRYHTIPFQSMLIVFVVSAIGINALTLVEMLGVTAFSGRRGWRVPFPLAQRVCCFASVGWLPGALIMGVGLWMIQAYGVGRPWFDHLMGLIRVGWLVYAALFVVSLLWFETLVWLGVRQVRYANALPESSG